MNPPPETSLGRNVRQIELLRQLTPHCTSFASSAVDTLLSPHDWADRHRASAIEFSSRYKSPNVASIDNIRNVGKIGNMKAELLYRERYDVSETAFYEVVVWSVPKPVPPTEHLFKYRLVLIANGERVIGFDNERGKGDHRHKGATELPYRFVSVEQLLDDFFREVDLWIAG